MVVHRKDDLKLYLGFRSEPFSKKRFVWKVDFLKVGPLQILKKKVLKIFSKIVVIFVFVYEEPCLNKTS